MKTIGVFFAPFQVSSIPEAHRNLLAEMHQHFTDVVIALPVRRVTPTKNAPLDYAARELMIRQYYVPGTHYVYIVPVVDKKYPEDQVKALESAAMAPFSEPANVLLYADADFTKLYKENGGKWFTPKNNVAAILLGHEADDRGKRPVLSQDYRSGVICGMRNQFPISWPTIDMAIRRVVVVDREAPPHTEVRFLFGKKPGEKNWRFAGGFKDRGDLNFEAAVYREGGEEVLQKGVKPGDVFDYPQYICSRNVNDWRYRGEIDGITTLFFLLNFHGTDDQIKAGDDLCDTAWLTIAEVRKQGIEGEHCYLLDALQEHEAKSSQNLNCPVCHTVLTCDCGIPPVEPYKQTYMEDCKCCGGTGKTRSTFQMGVDTICEVCCGVSKKAKK